MAKLTRFQIGEQSDDTFFDNSTGGIVPENHRIFNNHLNESFANLKDSNTFEGENTFQDTIQGDGGANFTDTVTMTAQFISNQVSLAIVITNNEVDLTNVEGNSIFIQGTDSILNWVGNVGAIFNATFNDTVYLGAQDGATILPNQNIQIYGGDTLILRFTGENQIQILGLKRFAGDFFQLNSIQDFQDIIDKQALQIGAYYLIPQGYDIWSELWDIIFFAKTQFEFDLKNVRVGYPDKNHYYPIQPRRDDPSDALQEFNFYTKLGANPTFTLNNLTYDSQITALFREGSSLILQDGENDFIGDVKFDSSARPILRNVQNIAQKEEPYFGRFLSRTASPPEFYSHTGSNLTGWGISQYFKDGLDANNLYDLNVGGGDIVVFSNASLVAIDKVQATYLVVNDNVTISFMASCTGKFNQSPNGHTFLLYFPLPFQNTENFVVSGHGVVRNTTTANFADQGAIIELVSGVGLEPWYCVLSSKHNNAITSNQGLVVNGTFTYQSKTTNY
jgi:hypothetical protein